MTDLPSPPVKGGEPTTEAGRRLLGRVRQVGMGKYGWMALSDGWSAVDASADILAIEAEARAPEQAAPPLDVERLAEAILRHDANDSWPSGSQIAHDLGRCGNRRCAETIAAEYARLYARLSHPEQTSSRHAAWCSLPVDHAGLCEGDQ